MRPSLGASIPRLTSFRCLIEVLSGLPIMRKQIFFSAVTLLTAVCALAQTSTPTSLPPIRIILVGDSTMAVRSGWGPGFSKDVVPEVTFLNMAKGGRSSGSYRAEGSWAKVIDVLKSNANFKATYVLIQFGDRKSVV